MDKILRRVRMAERQVVRRNKRNQVQRNGQEKADRMKELSFGGKQATHERRAAVAARREDMELGPLAPDRTFSHPDKFGTFWGAISGERALLRQKATLAVKQARSAWAGGPLYLCLAVGDRVVVTEGAYKGHIAPIETLTKENMTVTLAGNVGLINTQLPSFVVEPGQPTVNQLREAIPISAVRLVHPLQDPATGAIRDVIIRELKPVAIRHDRQSRKFFFSRIVPGLNVRIPWPKVPAAVRQDFPVDTLRIDVEERTFIPTLLRPPMPESVLDELRNRYSKFRTRHTEEYVAKIAAQEAEKKLRRKGARAEEMLLPVQEYNRKMREIRRQRGQPVLSEEMLAKIGEVIAKNKQSRSSLAPSSASDDVSEVQKAVEQLSLGSEPASTSNDEQPKA
ncbi:uncharacterized protein C8A04DRAFT_9772 [Dichotomopilus funicola]|uniref:Uncharacterized protein n=1 Tax=Dichotomopilus funicola TaxID=1934379 RepID=A0AAN6V8S4_9PEZI|nr:hypothetical protein C8A04DRAFT_9772 [Dichotomopilus funicola]